MKKVLIAGATGAMGQKAVALVNGLADTQLTAVLHLTLRQTNVPNSGWDQT